MPCSPTGAWAVAMSGMILVLQLACARIGAVHSVVFAGFSAESLAGRILDSKPSVVLTASAVKRGAKPINLKVLTLSFSASESIQTFKRCTLNLTEQSVESFHDSCTSKV